MQRFGNSILLLVAIALICSPAYACSIFCITHNGKTWFCNNEDWLDPITEIRFRPATEDDYAWVYLGFANNWSQGGVNEHGLCYDWVAGGGPFGWQTDPDKADFQGNLSEEMLRKCRNVDEAIAFYQKYNEKHLDGGRTLVADKQGNSVLVHWRDGKLQLEKRTDRLHSCGVGKIQIDARLEKKDSEVNLSSLAQALYEGRSRGTSHTLYSNVISLSDGKLYLFQGQDYSSYLEIEFEKLLKAGQTGRYKIADLFSGKTSPEHVSQKPSGFDWFKAETNAAYFASESEDTNMQSKLDSIVKRFVKRNGIPGASVAVVKDSRPIYYANAGLANVEQDRIVDDYTVFSLFSLTKVFVATDIFKMQQEGKLSVSDPISLHIDGLPESWKSITIQNLLTHSSGLPAIEPYISLDEDEAMQKVYADATHFEPGTRFRYTQTNFWLLNRLVRKVTGKSLKRHWKRTYFSDSRRDSYVISNDLERRLDIRAAIYEPDEKNGVKQSKFVAPDYMLGAGGLCLTTSEMILWANRFDNGEFINDETRKEMWTPFEYAEPDSSMANGWGIYQVNGHDSFGFTGGGRVGFRKFPEQNLAVIFFSNGYQFRFSPNSLINQIAGVVEPELRDPLIEAESKILAAFEAEKNVDKAKLIEELAKNNNSAETEALINRLGYDFLARKNMESALTLFQINTKLYPNSSNVWDSLGECHAASGERESAIKYYEKALALDPKSETASAALKSLKKSE